MSSMSKDIEEKIAVTAMSKIDEAVDSIQGAQAISARMQTSRELDPDLVRALQDIDDKLYDALAALGQ